MILFSSTQSEYQRRVKTLIKRYEREVGYSVEQSNDLPAFAEWIVNTLRVSIGPSTWRSYRYQLQQCLTDKEFVQAISVPPANKKKDLVTSNTSANRSKRLPDNEVALFKQYCRQSRSQYASSLLAMLLLGVKLGVRPSEWEMTRLFEQAEIPYIQVESAIKGHKDLPSLATRYIPVDHLSQEEQSLLDDFLVTVAGVTDFKAFLTNVTMFMRHTARAIYAYGEKRPSLYSARHQFAANLKASGVSKEVISAVMGHTDTDMQTKYYGRRTHGTSFPFNERAAAKLNNV